MLDRLFDTRNKTVTSLIKLGDCLGRSLRENVVLFSIDGDKEKVSYLTESDKVVTGDFAVDKDIILENIEVMSVDSFQDPQQFDTFISEKISDFTTSLNENKYTDTEVSFEEILSLWENRLKLNGVRNKLQEKSLKFDNSLSMTGTEEFRKFVEILPQVTTFLAENKEKISQVPEIINAFKLSNTVSVAFDFPKLDYAQLTEDKSYRLKDGEYTSIYEMICRQELVKQELLEARRNFSTVWANNNKIRALAGMLFESKESVEEVLAEAVVEIPYLALASKKQLFETIKNALALSEGVDISEDEVKKYAATLFEIKKPVKDEFLRFLNEKYGINIQNLKEPPSFKSLINTQVVIFESLARLSPKGSVQKQVLSEVAGMLKTKSGVEGIDVNDHLYLMFEDAGYIEDINERMDLNPASYGEIAQDFKSITDILELIRRHAEITAGDEQYEGDEVLDKEPEEMPDEMGAEMPDEMGAEMGEEMPLGNGDEDMDEPAMDADDVGLPPEPDVEDMGEVPEEEMEVPEEEMEVPEEQAKEELLNNLAELEQLIGDLQQDLGLANGEEGEEGEMDFDEEPGEEEPGLDAVGDEDEDIDNDGDHDGSDEYLAKRRKTIGKKIKGE